MPHRGIVLNPADLSYPHWPELMERVGLNLLILHSDYASLRAFMESSGGERLRRELQRRRIDLEFGMHFVGSFMTADLFARHPEYFAMDILGQRDEGGNPSVGHEAVLEMMANAAADAARRLTPTTGRHHLWAHDNRAWCNAPACANLSPSDQNLLLMNAALRGVRAVDPRATVAYAAYMETLPAPDASKVKPAEGVFLEFAPYRRSFLQPLDAAGCWANECHRRALDDLLAVFHAATATVLEYWIDVSYGSNYKKPAKPVAPGDDLLRRDVAYYASRGIQSISTFACWMDQAYIAAHGVAAVETYARALAGGGA